MAKQVYDFNGTKVRGDTYEQAASLASEITGDTTLNSSTLTQSPYFKLSQPKPSSETDGVLGSLEASASSFTTDLQTKADEAKNNRESAADAFFKQLATGEGQIALTDKAYSQTVDPLEGELKDINQQILEEQHGLRRQLEALQKNPTGMFGGALADKMQEVKDASLKRQADLSIVQMARQGRYDSAKAIADRAVQALLERQKNKLEALKLNYEDNKDLFNTAEQRAFEAAQGDRERDLANREYRLRAEFDQKLRTSDPLYQAQLREANLRNQKLAKDFAPSPSSPLASARQQQTIQDTKALLSDKGLNSAVGPTGLSRGTLFGIPFTPDSFTGAKANFIAGVEQLRSQLGIEALQQAKANGATFGALSDTELQMLSASASKLGTWAKKDSGGNVIGYQVNETAFKKELDRINNFAKLDYILKGGDPANVDVFEMQDGTFWTENSDGSFSQIH